MDNEALREGDTGLTYTWQSVATSYMHDSIARVTAFPWGRFSSKDLLQCGQNDEVKRHRRLERDDAMIADSAKWLVSEVRDLLTISSVGLYEFICLLRGEQPGITLDEGRTIAEQALRRLLSEGAVRLVLRTWPNYDSQGDVDPEAVRPSDWEDIREGQPYVALPRN